MERVGNEITHDSGIRRLRSNIVRIGGIAVRLAYSGPSSSPRHLRLGPLFANRAPSSFLSYQKGRK